MDSFFCKLQCDTAGVFCFREFRHGSTGSLGLILARRDVACGMSMMDGHGTADRGLCFQKSISCLALHCAAERSSALKPSLPQDCDSGHTDW